MKFINKHMSTFIAIFVFLVVAIGLFLAKSIFFGNASQGMYGNRLEGRDKVTITDETKNKVKDLVADKTASSNVRIAGRIIYITMKANGDVTLKAAKDLGSKTLEAFSDAEKEYYDIQVLIENDTNANQFPIIGYKHHTSKALVWTKDRAES